MNRTALITGASAGIGQAFAEELAEDGLNLILVARRKPRLDRLAERLRREARVTIDVIEADLADPAATDRILSEVETLGRTVDMLVNNAGYGVPGDYSATDWQTHARFIQVMVTAVAQLTHRCLPGMIERGYGRIIQLASLAGLVPGSSGHTLYGASKAFLIRFAESLSLELAGQGIHVTAVCPGFTYSEFHDVLGNRQQVSRLPAFMWMDARTVARQAIDAVHRGESVHINGAVNRALASLAKLIPHRAAIAVMRHGSRRIRTVEGP